MNIGWLCQRGTKSGEKFCAKDICWEREHLREKCGPMIYRAENFHTNCSCDPISKIICPFSNLFSWSFPPLLTWFVLPRTVFISRNKASHRIKGHICASALFYRFLLFPAKFFSAQSAFLVEERGRMYKHERKAANSAFVRRLPCQEELGCHFREVLRHWKSPCISGACFILPWFIVVSRATMKAGLGGRL